MEKQIHWLIQSSQDPTKVGMTVRGLVLMAGAPAVLQIANYAFGFAITSDQIDMFANEVSSVASQFAIGIGAIVTAYGLAMKAVARVNAWLVARKK